MVKKYLFVLNPKSGNGKGVKHWLQLEKELDKLSISYKCVVTEAKFHAAQIVKQGIESGYNNIIAIGGDGTVHECVNGIYQQKTQPSNNITLGIFPIGTGNDWVKSIGVPRKIGQWMTYFVNEKTILHKVGKITYHAKREKQERYFINIAGLGFEGATVKNACRKGDELLGGKLFYLLVVAKTLFRYKSQEMTINIDGKIVSGEKFCVTIGLNRFNGGGMQLLPNADPTDNFFDVAIIDKISVAEVLVNLPKLYNGKIIYHPKMMSVKAKEIEISSNENVLLEADGEFLGNTSVKLELIQQAIKVMII